MVKKSAISGDYVINILDSGTVQVLKKCADSVGPVSGTTDAQNYSPCTNTMGVLREIAASVGFTINEKSNTRSNGAKLVDFINANVPSVSKNAIKLKSAGGNVTFEAGPEPCEPACVCGEAVTEPVRDEDVTKSFIEPAEPAIVIEPSTLTNHSNEEFDEEEMAIIEELLKRIDALEARVEALESTSTHVAVNPNKLTGKVWANSYYEFCSDGHRRFFGRSGPKDLVLLSDGRRGYLKPILTNDCNITVGQTRQIADMFGYKYDSKTKREQLGFELVTRYGDGKWAFIANKAVNVDGETFILCEKQTLYSLSHKRWLSNESKLDDGRMFTDIYAGEPFKVDPNWTDEEILENLLKFDLNLVRK